MLNGYCFLPSFSSNLLPDSDLTAFSSVSTMNSAQAARAFAYAFSLAALSFTIATFSSDLAAFSSDLAASAFAMAVSAFAIAAFYAAYAFSYSSALNCLAAVIAFSLLAFATSKVKTVKIITLNRNVNNWFNAFIILFTLSFIKINLQCTISKSLGKFASSCFLISTLPLLL